MKNTFSLVGIGIIALSAATWGCTEDVSASQSAVMKLTAGTAAGSAGGSFEFVDDGGTTYTLTEGSLHLRKVVLEGGLSSKSSDQSETCDDTLDDSPCDDSKSSGSDDRNETEVYGPFIVDLMTGQSTPEINIPFGTYHQVKFQIEDGDPEDGLIETGDPLDDRSLVATAEFEYKGNSVNLHIALDFDTEVELEAENGIVVNANSSVSFNLAANNWLAGADIAACLDAGDLIVDNGKIVIDNGTEDSNTCGNIAELIKNNIKEHVEYEDEHESESESEKESADDESDDSSSESELESNS